MKAITVMLTASGSQFAPGIIRCFKNNREREIRVIGGDMSNSPSNRYLVDAFYQIPPVSDPNYAKTIASICKKENVDVLFPQMSAELPVYLDNIELFNEIGTFVSMTKGHTLEIANNKLKLLEFMKANNIPTAQFVGVNSFDEFEKGLTYLGYPEKPVCVKVPTLSGSRGIRIIDAKKSRYQIFLHEKPSSLITTKEDMIQVLKEAEEFPQLLLMEYLSGDEYSIGVLADNGKVKYLAGRRNPVMVMSISQESIVEKNATAYEIATQLVEKLNLDGVIGMDFMFSQDGDIKIMEINPRIDATMSVFAAAGLNLPYLCVKQILGEELPEININYGTTLKRRYHEFFTNAQGEAIYLED